MNTGKASAGLGLNVVYSLGSSNTVGLVARLGGNHYNGETIDRVEDGVKVTGEYTFGGVPMQMGMRLSNSDELIYVQALAGIEYRFVEFSVTGAAEGVSVTIEDEVNETKFLGSGEIGYRMTESLGLLASYNFGPDGWKYMNIGLFYRF